MSDDTDIGFKTRLIRVWAWSLGWCGRHQIAAAVIAGLLAGLLLPPVMRLIL